MTPNFSSLKHKCYLSFNSSGSWAWPKALLPSSLTGLLAGFGSSWAGGWKLAAQRASQKEGLLCTLALEVTSHPLCHILFMTSSSTRREVAQKLQKPQITLMRIRRRFSRAPNLVKSALRQLACNKHERSSSQMQAREPWLPANERQQMWSITSTHRTGRLQRRQK